MDIIVYLVSILLLAALIPTLLVAGYLRTRRRGYRAPGAVLVLLIGSTAGILEAYLWHRSLSPQEYRGVYEFFVIMWVPILGATATTWLLLQLLPRRNPRIFGHRRPLFPFATAGKGLIVLGALTCLFAFVWSAMGKGADSLISDSFKVLICATTFGGYLIFLGRHIKSAPTSLEEIARTDPRPPVLYLRPFNQEAEFFVSGRKSLYGQFAQGLQRFAMHLGETLGNDTALSPDPMVGIRFEGYFISALHSRIGPFFALGNPEDYTLPEGAVRSYATDTDWKDHLERLARKASCIVAEIASSDNLRWEFEYLRREGLQTKLFILTRPLSSANLATTVFYKLVARLKGVPPITWPSFTALLEPLGYKLPADPGPGAVITFNHSGEMTILTSGAHAPVEYIEPIRTFLIESFGHSADQFTPPPEPKPAPHVTLRKGSLLTRLVSELGALTLVVLIITWSFRSHIPVLRDIGVPGGASMRTGLELYEHKHYAEALPYFERAASAGNMLAMTDLGFMNEKGLGGFSPDDAKAANWYRRGADAGSSQAMVNLATFYVDGRGGLTKDYGKALDLCRQAAEGDNPNAMALLGYFYENGLGTSKDLTAARDWYEKSADRDNTFAKNRLNQLRSSLRKPEL